MHAQGMKVEQRGKTAYAAGGRRDGLTFSSVALKKDGKTEEKQRKYRDLQAGKGLQQG